MKYLRKYNTTEEYNSDISNIPLPGVSYVTSEDVVYYNPIPSNIELIDLSDNTPLLNLIDRKTVNVTYNRILGATDNGDGTWTPKSATICLPYDVDISNADAKLYLLLSVSLVNKKMYFEQVYPNIICAGQPYIIIINSGSVSFNASNVKLIKLPIDKEVLSYEESNTVIGLWRGTFDIISNDEAAELKAHTLSKDGKFRRISNAPGYQSARVVTFRAFFMPYESDGFYAFTPVYLNDYSESYLTIVSLQDNNTIGWKTNNVNLLKTISVSTDNGFTWTEKTSSIVGTTLAALNTEDRLLIRGINTNYASSYGVYNYNNYFTSSANFDVEGNIMSLCYGDNFIGQTALDSSGKNFKLLFLNCNKLISAKNLILPAITLAGHCYERMFYMCTSLISAPELPATILTECCYNDMFCNCTTLTIAPELPATTLVYGCYGGMFQNCSSLNYIKCLATDISATNCTGGWMNNVASIGMFTKAASMRSWTIGDNGIPTNWTVVDCEYVDLGLPSGTKWATMNIGATDVTDYGLYFQWGDTQGYTADQVSAEQGKDKKGFNWIDYKYSLNDSSSTTTMTKYNSSDGLVTLEVSDDAAVANMGSSWRIPTEAEFNELLDESNCTRMWITNYNTNNKGINGYLFTSRSNGNTLFFPAAGFCSDGSINGGGSYGFYWSSSLNRNNVVNGRSLYFSSSYCDMDYNRRCYGYAVRGVMDA